MTNLVPRIASRNGLRWFDDDFGDFFEGFFRPARLIEPTRNVVPAVDVSEDDNGYVVRAELPGVKKEDIDVTLEDGVLTISAETKSKSESEEKDGERVIRQERRYGKYSRSLRLGTQVDEGKVKASYKDGILQLVLPKSEAVKPKRIAVDVG
ncbi:MAG: Hsp20/alpha crystallin family protein [Proteobacteria bacterium]|nr:MAG: Hsp20/alpha crystallin family protein [Pseudomonadota bacterium]